MHLFLKNHFAGNWWMWYKMLVAFSVYSGCHIWLAFWIRAYVKQKMCFKNRIRIQRAVTNMLFILSTWRPKGKLGSVAEGSAILIWGPAGGGGGPMLPFWILKNLMSMFINACRLLSALPSLSQLGWGRLSVVAISFYALSLLFGPCRLSEFTLAGPLIYFCVAQWVLFIVLSIFCIMSVGDWTRPKNQETTHEFSKRYIN